MLVVTDMGEIQKSPAPAYLLDFIGLKHFRDLKIYIRTRTQSSRQNPGEVQMREVLSSNEADFSPQETCDAVMIFIAQIPSDESVECVCFRWP